MWNAGKVLKSFPFTRGDRIAVVFGALKIAVFKSGLFIFEAPSPQSAMESSEFPWRDPTIICLAKVPTIQASHVPTYYVIFKRVINSAYLPMGSFMEDINAIMKSSMLLSNH